MQYSFTVTVLLLTTGLMDLIPKDVIFKTYCLFTVITLATVKLDKILSK